MISDENIKKRLSKLDFSCNRCSNCCRNEQGNVYITRKDLANLSSFLNLSKDEFVKQYCRIVTKQDKKILALLEKVNYDCIFWENGCIVYQKRPLQCITYPYWPILVENGDHWKYERYRCSGIDKKSSLTIEEKFKFYTDEKNAKYIFVD